MKIPNFCLTCGKICEKNLFCGLDCFKKRTTPSVPVTLEIENYIDQIEQEKADKDRKEILNLTRIRNNSK